jgi:hypothetical protein
LAFGRKSREALNSNSNFNLKKMASAVNGLKKFTALQMGRRNMPNKNNVGQSSQSTLDSETQLSKKGKETWI